MDNDNTKRTLLAVVLSTIVIVAWGYFFQPQPQPQPAQEQAATAQPSPSAQVDAAIPGEPAPVAPAPAFAPSAGRDVVVDTPLYRAVFNSAGGILTSFELKQHTDSIAADARPVNLIAPQAVGVGPLGLLWQDQGTWRAESSQWAAPATEALNVGDQGAELTFQGSFGGLAITRHLRFAPDTYLIEEVVTLANTTGAPIDGRLGFNIGVAPLTAKDDNYNPTRVSFLDAKGVDDESDREDLAAGLRRADGVKWGAIQSNYFTVALAPEDGDLTLKSKFTGDLFRMVVDKDGVSIAPGTSREVKASYYLGPVMSKYLSQAPHGLDSLVTYGFFDIISVPLMKGLLYIHSVVGNWGVAIIILTIIIKLAFWPLSQKSYQSMNKMKKIQPLMAKVREQYKDDRQKMNEEMMRLYKTYKVNPAGGCLPMLLQIPVFLALYQALLGAVELRHAAFIPHLPFTDLVWLADLSAKDPFYITPLVMGATMFLQQKMTPAPGDPTQAKIMLFMPVIFTFMFLNFPSGLVVYWLVNNVLSIAQQWWLLRKA
ncbi:membrane protein insertase YidC [Desulfocurvus sp.]|uniref:membrane protein insertase YidC n=1 Tax=Desulfocurvus sp. TaxID=2871698 RepID=UPI0025C217A0|nr:membrane protein insertase YidC [Desulfocurvus sp.]MCK9239431.1 membrane protein insertase YidC [Desulfocurvus sp.]